MILDIIKQLEANGDQLSQDAAFYLKDTLDKNRYLQYRLIDLAYDPETMMEMHQTELIESENKVLQQINALIHKNPEYARKIYEVVRPHLQDS